MKKRILSMILVLAMCFSLLSLPAQAADSAEEPAYSVEIQNSGESTLPAEGEYREFFWRIVDRDNNTVEWVDPPQIQIYTMDAEGNYQLASDFAYDAVTGDSNGLVGSDLWQKDTDYYFGIRFTVNGEAQSAYGKLPFTYDDVVTEMIGRTVTLNGVDITDSFSGVTNKESDPYKLYIPGIGEDTAVYEFRGKGADKYGNVSSKLPEGWVEHKLTISIPTDAEASEVEYDSVDFDDPATTGTEMKKLVYYQILKEDPTIRNLAVNGSGALPAAGETDTVLPFIVQDRYGEPIGYTESSDPTVLTRNEAGEYVKFADAAFNEDGTGVCIPGTNEWEKNTTYYLSITIDGVTLYQKLPLTYDANPAGIDGFRVILQNYPDPETDMTDAIPGDGSEEDPFYFIIGQDTGYYTFRGETLLDKYGNLTTLPSGWTNASTGDIEVLAWTPIEHHETRTVAIKDADKNIVCQKDLHFIIENIDIPALKIETHWPSTAYMPKPGDTPERVVIQIVNQYDLPFDLTKEFTDTVYDICYYKEGADIYIPVPAMELTTYDHTTGGHHYLYCKGFAITNTASDPRDGWQPDRTYYFRAKLSDGTVLYAELPLVYDATPVRVSGMTVEVSEGYASDGTQLNADAAENTAVLLGFLDKYGNEADPASGTWSIYDTEGYESWNLGEAAISESGAITLTPGVRDDRYTIAFTPKGSSNTITLDVSVIGGKYAGIGTMTLADSELIYGEKPAVEEITVRDRNDTYTYGMSDADLQRCISTVVIEKKNEDGTWTEVTDTEWLPVGDYRCSLSYTDDTHFIFTNPANEESGQQSGRLYAEFSVSAKPLDGEGLLFNGKILSEAAFTGTYTGDDSVVSFPIVHNGAYSAAHTLIEDEDFTIIYTHADLYVGGKPLDEGSYVAHITGKGNYSGTVTMNCTIVPQTLDVVTLEAPAPVPYNKGKEITPHLVITDGEHSLYNWVDYYYACAVKEGDPNAKLGPNALPVNAGTYVITIIGKQGYYGTLTCEFTVLPQSIEDMAVEEIAECIYTGNPITPEPTVMWGEDLTLTMGTDYTAEYSNNVNVGAAAVTITGKGNYTGELSHSFTISAKSLLDGITLEKVADMTYTGSALTPALDIRHSGKQLVKDRDYTVVCSKNVDVGTATATVTGIGNYKDGFNVSFKILPNSLANAVIGDIDDQMYTGDPITPAFTVTDEGIALVEGTDYTIEYSDNTDAGTATVTVTGIGNYTGSCSDRFTITAKEIAAEDITVSEMEDVTFTNSAIAPVPTVTAGESQLVNGTDFTVSYAVKEGDANAKLDADGRPFNAGTYVITITGIGNYSISASCEFTILPKSIEGMKVEGVGFYQYTGSPITPVPTVKWGVALTLAKDVDYSVDYEGNINVSNAENGFAYVVITGKGNYTGVIRHVFVINNKSLTNTITFRDLPDATYTGSALTPEPVVEYLDNVLVKDRDYTLDYSNNINAGTATVTVTGIGSFKDSVELTFTIAKASLHVTAKNQFIRVGDTIPDLSAPVLGTHYTVSGLKASDTFGGAVQLQYLQDGQPVVPDSSKEGSYVISITGENTEKNYEVEFVSGRLTVEAEPSGGESGESGESGDSGNTGGEGGNTGEAGGQESYETCDGSICPMQGYADLDISAWYHDGVHFCLEHGLMNGIGSNEFGPNETTTRAMIVTILWRLEGSPVVNYAMSFEDVEAELWYTEAIRWAASEGIVDGYSDTAFGPTDSITREQLAVILYRYEQYKGGGFQGLWMYPLNYADTANVSDWAYEAMCWMNMNGVISGRPGNILDPKGGAIRAEAAAMLQRYCTLGGK